MTVVIADDLSGAAELASAAAQRGLRAEVQTAFDPSADADVVAIDTNTRSAPADEAGRRVGALARTIVGARPSWIYKKTDSVLRGNIRVEIEAILAATGKRRSLFVPANPGKGRVIRTGGYFIHGTPLAQTAFAHDPEHPRLSSVVRELLGPSETIVTPDAPDAASLAEHARAVDDATLSAGGVEFFEALLETRGVRSAKVMSPPSMVGPTLFVCGSAAAWRLGRAEDCRRFGVPVTPMPEALFRNPSDSTALAAWVEQLVGSFKQSKTVMAAIARADIEPRVSPHALVAALANAAASVAAQAGVGRICLEGGATARALFDARGRKRFRAFAPPASGVAALSPLVDRAGAAEMLFIKPGSYPWPDSVWAGLR